MASKSPVLGQRHLQTLLLFLCLVTNFMTQMNIGVLVVAMTNAETTNPNFDEYQWNEMEKSYILSSFFCGYFITQFPGGYLCRRFGVKLTMFFATLGSALFAILPPICVPWGGWKVYCGIRVIQGLFQGPLFPCAIAHLAAWCPINERNRLGALVLTGVECGTLLAMFVTGIIASSSMGWPGVAYVTGAVGLAWCMLWWFFAANSPIESKWISAAELECIETSKNDTKQLKETTETAARIPVPWNAIFNSMPFWALVVARCSYSWGFYTLQAQIPSYMNGVLNMDMKENALFSALPYLAMWCMSYVFMIASDLLLNHKILSLKAIRKCFHSLGCCVPAMGLIWLGFVGEEQKTLAIVLMTANVGVNAAVVIGSALNAIDLSPNHAGILMGIINTAANFIPVLTPLLVGNIVTDEHDQTQWQIVFAVSALVLAVGNLIYVVFGSMDVQPWNGEEYLTNREIANEVYDKINNDDNRAKIANKTLKY